ncbi:hypothetical protein CBOM_05512 [Ceraceosorus bombacis]|uniref:Uncharacterized protein n=1 Tax=Ceraceosorus bombacis TaxID=401625 RepID=A0A0P1BPE1_9BASI|nr:hypothetical protein CBOM_05512 [Ceraceosorus bombacis]
MRCCLGEDTIVQYGKQMIPIEDTLGRAGGPALWQITRVTKPVVLKDGDCLAVPGDSEVDANPVFSSRREPMISHPGRGVHVVDSENEGVVGGRLRDMMCWGKRCSN